MPLRYWRTARRLCLIGASLVLLAVAVFGAAYFLPGLFPTSPYHPRVLVNKWRGIDVHPFTPISSDAVYYLRVSDLSWPRLSGGPVHYEAILGAQIAEFQERFPGASCTVELHPLYKERTGSESTPPDVYIGPVAGAPRSGAVNIRPFAPKLVRLLQEQLPGLAAYCEHVGQPFCWPLWLELGGWLANGNLLRSAGVDPLDIQQNGWSWEDCLLFLGKTTSAGAAEYAFAPKLNDPSGVLQLAVTAGLRMEPDFGLDSSRVRLESAFRFLDEMRQEKMVPGARLLLAKPALQRFLEGELAAIAAPRAGVLRYVSDALTLGRAANGLEPVFLPVPYVEGLRPVVPCSLWVVAPSGASSSGETPLLDMNAARQRLAVELSQYLFGRMGAWLPARLKFAAVHPLIDLNGSPGKRALEDFGVSEVAGRQKDYLTLDSWPAVDLFTAEAGARLPFTAESLQQAWESFWLRGFTPEQAAGLISK